MTFTNNQIDTESLPKFEQVHFNRINKRYLVVILFNLAIAALFLAAVIFFLYVKVDDFEKFGFYMILCTALLYALVVFFSILGFFKRGYAFREHDVVYKNSVLATSTMVIPYNRVQHVALHEGPVARLFGYTRIKIYTAGAGSGDLGISGIPKDEAQNIKQLLMGKIQKTLD